MKKTTAIDETEVKAAEDAVPGGRRNHGSPDGVADDCALQS